MDKFIYFIWGVILGALCVELLLNYSKILEYFKNIRILFNTKETQNDIPAYIDLGLPSGNLWANSNYKTSVVQPKGLYFSFEQVVDLNNNLEVSVSIPTREDFLELLKVCTWKPQFFETTEGKKFLYGYIIIGPNKNSIFLPVTGSYYGDFLLRIYDGYYWSKTDNGGSSALSLFFTSSNQGINYINKNCRRPIRLIKHKQL